MMHVLVIDRVIATLFVVIVILQEDARGFGRGVGWVGLVGMWGKILFVEVFRVKMYIFCGKMH